MTYTREQILSMPANVGMLNGHKLIENDQMVDMITTQRKTHRKKRTNKKWAKRYGFDTKTTPKKDVYYMSGIGFVGHPATIRCILDAMEQSGGTGE